MEEGISFMRSLITALILLAPLAAAAPALADDDAGIKSCTDRPQSEWMSEEAAGALLTAQGYDVRGVEVEGTCYEVKALKNGNRVEVFVNPVTGAITIGSDDDGDE
jgi:hypothetical protein